MEPGIRQRVDIEWARRFGLSPKALNSGTVHVVTVDIGANDAMSFLLEETCVVVVRPDDLDVARTALSGLHASEAFTADVLRTILGPDARVDGPSWHSYANQRTFRGAIDRAVQPI